MKERGGLACVLPSSFVRASTRSHLFTPAPDFVRACAPSFVHVHAFVCLCHRPPAPMQDRARSYLSTCTCLRLCV